MILLRKVQTCHTKRRPGEIRARGQLWETRFLIIACPSIGASHPTPNTENLANFSENRGGRDHPLERGQDFLPGASLQFCQSQSWGKCPWCHFCNDRPTLLSPPEKTERKDSRRHHANHIKIMGAFWFSWILRRELWAQKHHYVFWKRTVPFGDTPCLLSIDSFRSRNKEHSGSACCHTGMVSRDVWRVPSLKGGPPLWGCLGLREAGIGSSGSPSGPPLPPKSLLLRKAPSEHNFFLKHIFFFLFPSAFPVLSP